MRGFAKAVSIGAFVILLPVAFFAGYAYRLKVTADRVVQFSCSLSQQQHRPTVQDLQRKFGNLLRQPAPCTAAGCGYEIMLSNGAFARFHLVSYTALRSYFWASGDALDVNELMLWSMGSKGHMVLTTIETKYCKDCEPFSVIPCGDADEGIASGSVMTEPADPRNHGVFGLNTACLTRLRGCDTVADLLPTVWHNEPTGAVRCLQKTRP